MVDFPFGVKSPQVLALVSCGEFVSVSLADGCDTLGVMLEGGDEVGHLDVPEYSPELHLDFEGPAAHQRRRMSPSLRERFTLRVVVRTIVDHRLDRTRAQVTGLVKPVVVPLLVALGDQDEAHRRCERLWAAA